jgi:hypothetical protein
VSDDDGSRVGSTVGKLVGFVVGNDDGSRVGFAVGNDDGNAAGIRLFADNDPVGIMVSSVYLVAVGNIVGTNGDSIGVRVSNNCDAGVGVQVGKPLGGGIRVGADNDPVGAVVSPEDCTPVGIGVGVEPGTTLSDPYCTPAQIAMAEMMPTGIPQNNTYNQGTFRSDMHVEKSHL